MSQKRGGSFNHYEDDRHKRHRHNESRNPNLPPLRHAERNGYGYGNRPAYDNKLRNKDNAALQHIERLPEPDNCKPCKLAAAEMQTGMVALLDKLAAEELRPDGDRDILHHARELHRLLSARANRTVVSQSKQALDEKRPPKDKYVSVPAYIEQKIKRAKDLPPLPSITEPSLQEAVFTHFTYHTYVAVKGFNSDTLNYEQLEFLGDAYIELMASRLIYSRLPHVDVSQQSHFREQLTKNETLSRFSNAYGLPDRLKHGGHLGDSKAWNKVVADIFEAYVAAIVLSDPENGFATAEKWLIELWTPQLLDFKEDVVENPKARDDIQRLVLVKGIKLDYREERNMVQENGLQKYFIGLYMTGWGYEDEWLGSGEGRNKVQASVFAAMDALQRDSVALKTASRKKKELVQQRKQEERMHKEAEKQKEGAEPSGECKKVSSDSSTNENQPKESHSNSNTWIEKEKKKKEKKEKREKEKREKKQRAGSNGSSP